MNDKTDKLMFGNCECQFPISALLQTLPNANHCLIMTFCTKLLMFRIAAHDPETLSHRCSLTVLCINPAGVIFSPALLHTIRNDIKKYIKKKRFYNL